MENKPKTNTVLLVIVTILLVVGLVYVFFNKSKTVPENISVNNNPQENQNNQASDNISLLTYNYPERYSVDYPKNWVIASDTKTENGGVFSIKNSSEAIPTGANSQMRSIDSFIDIQLASYEIDPLIHKTIDDVLKDPKFGVSKTNRINNVVDMNIGGKSLRVEPLNTEQSKGYSFLYDGNVYHIDFVTGSKEQYQKDKEVFDNMIQSFKLLNSEESTSETFNHQPGAIKSVKYDGVNKWIFAVDLLTYNTGWSPGVNDRYSNQNTKIRNLNVTSDTKIYGCVSGPDGGGPDVSKVPNIDTSKFIVDIQKRIENAKEGTYRIGSVEHMTDWVTLSFDIIGTNITAIYEACLP